MRFTQIVFRHMAGSPDIGERIRELSGTLEERYPAIERCRAAVEDLRAPNGAQQFKVTIELRVAGAALVACAHGPEIEPVLQSVFADLETKMQARPTQPRAA